MARIKASWFTKTDLQRKIELLDTKLLLQDKERYMKLYRKSADDEIKEQISQIIETYEHEIEKRKNGEKSTENDIIEYPKGTSKEYTKWCEEKFEQAKVVLGAAGINVVDITDEASAKEVLQEYVFDEFEQENPKNYYIWMFQYQPIVEAVESVLRKRKNDLTLVNQ